MNESIRKHVTSALLLPFAGIAIIQAASQSNPAFASALSASLNTVVHQATVQPAVPQPNGQDYDKKSLQQLHLSSTQQAQLKSLWEQSKTSSHELHQQLKAVRDQLTARLVSTSTGDDDALRQAHRRLKVIRQQIQEQRLETMLKFRNVLTTQQRIMLAGLLNNGGYQTSAQSIDLTNALL